MPSHFRFKETNMWMAFLMNTIDDNHYPQLSIEKMHTIILSGYVSIAFTKYFTCIKKSLLTIGGTYLLVPYKTHSGIKLIAV